MGLWSRTSLLVSYRSYAVLWVLYVQLVLSSPIGPILSPQDLWQQGGSRFSYLDRQRMISPTYIL